MMGNLHKYSSQSKELYPQEIQIDLLRMTQQEKLNFLVGTTKPGPKEVAYV